MTFQLGDLVADPRVPVVTSVINTPVPRVDREELAYKARGLEKFDVTAAYVWHRGLDDQAQSLANFPPLRMPYPSVWVEAATHLRDESRFGALVIDGSVDEWADLVKEIRAENPDSVFSDRMLIVKPLGWDRDNGLQMSPLYYVVNITTLGEYRSLDVSTGGIERWPGITLENVRVLAALEQTYMLRPLLFGMSLSNVKGSRTSEPRLLGNPHAKKGKRRSPRNRYRVITIPGSPADERRSAGGHRDMAKHLVRGHFKHFRNYFGRGPATIWVPFHTRGKREHGAVEKDYQVDPPE